MKQADKAFLSMVDRLADERRTAIRESASQYPSDGTHYYISPEGNDGADGLTPETAKATIAAVNELPLKAGDSVLFKRGGMWRGHISAKTEHITYSAYGEGAKPVISGSPESGIGAEKWTPVEGTKNIWCFYRELADVGGIVFDDGKLAAIKKIPAYRGGFVVREGENDRPFDLAKDLDEDLSFFCRIDNEIWQGRPVIAHVNNVGKLYLRCDRGNPGEVFTMLEFFGRGHTVAVAADYVTIDNLCLMYCGTHSVGSGDRTGLCVRNTEIGWGGGCIQFYHPNGGVTRFGNGVEIYVGCRDFTIQHCYVYQIYDAAVTNQFKGACGHTVRHENVLFADNLMEYNIYSIEYFLEQDNNEEQIMRNVVYRNNILRFSGYGWGSYPSRAAHIKGWDHRNISEGFVIENNIFDRSRGMMIHCGVQEAKHLPLMKNNTYIAIDRPDRPLGRFGERGSNSFSHVEGRLPYSEDIIRNTVHDDGEVYVTSVEPDCYGVWKSGM